MAKFTPLFDPNMPNVAKMLEPHSGILYWDEQLDIYYKLYIRLRDQFWHAQEVSLTNDTRDWHSNMNDKQKELFRRGIGQLVVLDSLATQVDGQFAHFIQNPAISSLMIYIASQEAIHNESYTYICTSFMTKEESDAVFERPKTDPVMIKANQPILDCFNAFQKDSNPYTLAMALAAMAALEGIRFTNGFVPFYYLNRARLMQGTGSIINLINRDETQHSFTQSAITRDLIGQYPDEIDENKLVEDIYELYRKVVAGEQGLVDSMYEGIEDIDKTEVKMYVEWRANSILANLGLEKIFDTKRNPMRWISVFDPENNNNQKTDFFEKRVTNYQKTSESKNGFDDL